MPTEKKNLEGEFACLEDINLENFFTEYLIFMHGTIFLCEWCDSQIWHILMAMLKVFSMSLKEYGFMEFRGKVLKMIKI